MYVKSRMQTDLVTIHGEDNLHTALVLMREKRIHQLPVTVGKKLIGIITDRDIRQASSPGLKDKKLEMDPLLSSIRVEEIMAREVITVSPQAPLEDAILLLYLNRFGGLPVVEGDGELVGIITKTDILKAFIETLGIGEPSSRLELVLEDSPGALAEVVKIIQKYNINISSIMSAPHEEKNKKNIFLRLATIDLTSVKEALLKAGYTIIQP